MPKQQISTDKAAPPGGAYSQCIRAGDFIYVAGQGPGDPATGRFVGDTIEEQTAQTLRNVFAILAAAGASPADIVKSTVHLSDLALFGRFNGVYAEMVPDPKPVRTTVGSQLPPGMLIEVDVVAYVEDLANMDAARLDENLRALAEAYAQARADGLCAEGAWEAARQRLSPADLAATLRAFPDLPAQLGELDD